VISIENVEITPYKNLLVYPNIDGAGWTKAYEKNIVYTFDGPDSTNPTIATFQDAETGNSQGYWYSYGDYSPQEADTEYVVQLWAKVEEGYADVNFYTSDNTESANYPGEARYWSPSIRVNSTDGWKLLTWEFKTAPTWYSDSLSYQWSGTWGALDKTMSISAPSMMTKEDYYAQGLYTEKKYLIQVSIKDAPVIYNELDINIWDNFDDINTWNDIDQNPSQVRYIRDYLGQGSTANGANHWVEIQAFDSNDINVALNKTAYVDNNPSLLAPNLVDGDVDTTQWTLTNMSAGTYKTVDLGQIYTLNSIKVWHYYGDGRTYLFNKKEVSTDGIKWVTVFDSSVQGTYPESAAGHEIIL